MPRQIKGKQEDYMVNAMFAIKINYFKGPVLGVPRGFLAVPGGIQFTKMVPDGAREASSPV